MNKKILNLLTILVSIGLFILMLININTLKQSVINSSLLFIKNVFPTLFINSILASILINTNLDAYIYKLTRNIYPYIIFISILAGCPLNAIILKSYYDKKYINKLDLELLLPITTINNPIFIYNYLKLLFNNNIPISLIIIIYLLIIITYFIIKPKLAFNDINFNYCSSLSLPNIIKSSISNMLNVFATIVFFKAISDVIFFKTTPVSCTIRGIIEVTQGLECLLKVKITSKIKETLVQVFLLFTGFSIHIQISNVLNNDINYKYFYIIKGIQIIILMLCLLVSLYLM